MKLNQRRATANKELSKIVGMIQANLALNIIAMHEYLGFGGKRLNEYLNNYEKLVAEFAEYERDGVADYKIKQCLEKIGVDYRRIFEPVPTVDKLRQHKINTDIRCVPKVEEEK